MDEGPTISVLVVDGDGERRRATVDALAAHDRLSVDGAATIDEAELVLQQQEIDCVVARHRLPDGISVDLFRYANRGDPTVGTIVFDDVVDGCFLPAELGMIYAAIDSSGEGADAKLVETIVDGFDDGAYGAFPVPDDEGERLAVLEDLDVAAQDALDRLVEQARDHFDVEMASVRVVEADQQRYIATCGFDADTLPRGESVCAHTIMEDDVMVIEHLQDDPRWKDVAFYQRNDIDWYAGAVIRVDGQAIGTFCLEDGDQQRFTDRDRRALQDFADHAATLIAARHEIESGDARSIGDIVRQAEDRAG